MSIFSTFSLLSFIVPLLLLDTINPYSIRHLQLYSLSDPSSYSQQVFELLNWKQNDQIISGLNAQGNLTFSVRHNQFSYLSFLEIQQRYLTLSIATDTNLIPKVQSIQAPTPKVSFPTIQLLMTVFGETLNVDWRKKGFVTAVRNQGSCGACWAFAATAQLQSFYLMKRQVELTLSDQQLIDCSSSYGNLGCQGGMMDNAFRYVRDNSIATASVYPYKGVTNSCQNVSSSSYSITQSKIIYSDCSALTQLLKKQPTTVVVSVNIAFVFYSQGILNSCGSSINHAIQLVGYYKDSNQAYYIGKNSWGKAWGEEGFIRIDATVEEGNLCNVCTYPQYVA